VIALINTTTFSSQLQGFPLLEPDINDFIEEPKDSKYITESAKSFKPATFNIIKAFTSQGDFQEIIRLPKPIFSYHAALPRTLEKFDAQLSELFPELSNLTDEELEKISRKRDDSG
jgi:hypothetical protein